MAATTIHSLSDATLYFRNNCSCDGRVVGWCRTAEPDQGHQVLSELGGGARAYAGKPQQWPAALSCPVERLHLAQKGNERRRRRSRRPTDGNRRQRQTLVRGRMKAPRPACHRRAEQQPGVTRAKRREIQWALVNVAGITVGWLRASTA